MAAIGAIPAPNDIHFRTRDELAAALADEGSRIVEVGRRREL